VEPEAEAEAALENNMEEPVIMVLQCPRRPSRRHYLTRHRR
jgi:hypothetical protein